MKNISRTTKKIAVSGMLIAIATVLSLFTLVKMPQGGSVTPGSMIPVILIAFLYGVPWGMLCGGIYGAIQIMIGGSFAGLTFWGTVACILLDYIAAFAVLAVAGLFKKTRSGLIFSCIAAVGARFVCHLLSGVILFSSYAGDMNPWLYSAAYNGSFLAVELAVNLAVFTIFGKFFIDVATGRLFDIAGDKVV